MFDLRTVTNGISCIGLSITLSNDIIVSTSMDSKYVFDESLKTGIFSSEISFS